MKRRNLARALGAFATLWLAACSNDTTAPASTPLDRPDVAMATAEVEALAAEVRRLAANRGVTRMSRPAPIRPELVQLGQALVFDKILSGNRNISCMTCHFPSIGTDDDRSVSVAEGGTGIGVNRVHPQNKFIHRNAPPVFNLHVMKKLMWDGRIHRDSKGVVRGPASLRANQRAVFEFGAISAQPMFPLLSRTEMRGVAGTNDMADVPDSNHQRVWWLAFGRLRKNSEYRAMFARAYPGAVIDTMNFAHAANAMAAFMISSFAFSDTPWDRFLAGNTDAMTEVQIRGARNFLTGRCVQCHNGQSLSDGNFHNVAVPQIGPGMGDGANKRDDFGRMRESKLAADKYKFRTPPLRNVELTAPYGHDGAIVSLRAWVDHYSDSDVKLQNYDVNQLEPLLRTTLQPTTADILATRDTRLAGLVLSAQVVDEITEFLKALTDPAARDLRHLVPARVPSGLPLDNIP
jgi:cytochrome c peroxidase